MKPDKKYSGIVIPAVTPLTQEHQLDEAAVDNMLDYFRRHGVHPFILGTTGESASIPVQMKKQYLQLAGKLKREGEMLYAGISSNCLSESIDAAKECFDLGVDAVAATLPSYYALTEDEMLRYFEQLANSILGPLIIYNIPATTHMSIPLPLIEKLSYHEHIVGTKDSERSEERLKTSMEWWSNRADFSHFLGWAARSAMALKNGSDGLIPSTGNLFPSVYRDMMDAVNNGDEEKTNRRQELSDLLGNLYQSGRTLGGSLWALKVLMHEAGLCGPWVMPPLREGSREEAAQLLHELVELKKKENINF
jgi:4-hydroxy-tetrahydrodipicolinate synthase